jgi:hypothetical protein
VSGAEAKSIVVKIDNRNDAASAASYFKLKVSSD